MTSRQKVVSCLAPFLYRAVHLRIQRLSAAVNFWSTLGWGLLGPGARGVRARD